MSATKTCPLRVSAGFTSFYSVCIREGCAWWVEDGERMKIVPTEGYVNGEYARTAETICENVPGHCAILDIIGGKHD